MSDPNIFEPAWDAEYAAPPFRLRASHVAAQAGARLFAALTAAIASDEAAS